MYELHISDGCPVCAARQREARNLVKQILSLGNDHGSKSEPYERLVELAQERRPELGEEVALHTDVVPHLIEAVRQDELLETMVNARYSDWHKVRREDSEEIVSTTLEIMARKLGKFGWQGSFKGWVFAILESRRKDHLRIEEKRVSTVAFDREYDDGDRYSSYAVAQIEIPRVLKDLPPHHVEILELLLIKKLGRDEIMEFLGLNDNQYRGRLHRAQAAFERAVGEALDDD